MNCGDHVKKKSSILEWFKQEQENTHKHTRSGGPKTQRIDTTVDSV